MSNTKESKGMKSEIWRQECVLSYKIISPTETKQEKKKLQAFA